jgi:hypothetical protein
MDVQRRVVEDEDGLVFHSTQDVEGILDLNKAAFNDGTRGYTPSRDLRKIAEIPLIIAEKWKNELGVDVFDKNHADAVRRLLNDPEWLYLRTAPGRV